MAEKTFYFLRHGHTDPFVKRVFCGGDWDVPLNEAGLQQAGDVAEMYSSAFKDVEVVLVSPMLRTRQMAAPICQKHQKPCVEIDGFREWRLGSWNGISWDDLPSIFDTKQEPPQGEIKTDFTKRVRDSILENIERYDCFVVVSHGLVWHAFSKLYGLETHEVAPSGLLSVAKTSDGWTVDVLRSGVSLEDISCAEQK